MTARGKKITTVSLTLVLAVYLLIACAWGRRMAANQVCAGLEGGMVQVIDPSGVGFVLADSITGELSPIIEPLGRMRMADVNLGAIRSHISALDKIESAEVTMLSNNKLRISVKPMVPVARVWPADGRRSYYVNREGKHIAATPRYHLNVPQLLGNLPAGTSPDALLPLLDYLNDNPDIKKLITMISVADTANIILVPAIRGHVINIGDVSDIPSKFRRLRTFYRKVLPVMGWEYYDTLSVKWAGQLVASRRHGKLPPPPVHVAEIEDINVPAVEEQ